ncbi:MAG: acyltransferase family protein [Chloroflexota bacterium]
MTLRIPAVFRLQPREIGALTGLRGIGAIWVFVAHLEAQLHGGVLTSDAGGYLIGSAYMAVDGFFILSGFVIAANYRHFFERLDRGDYLRFLVVRLGRVYPVHLFTLVAILGLVVIAARVGRTINTADADYSIGSFMTNLFLVQSWGTAHLSWNVPAWSVSVEWFAYLVFPVAAFHLLRAFASNAARLALVGVSYAVVVLCTTWFVDWVPALSLLRVTAGFGGGVMVWMWVRDRGPGINRRPLIALVSATAFIASIVGLAAAAIPVGYLPAVLLVPLIFGLTGDTGLVAAVFRSRIAVFLGRVSYSVYLVHTWVIFAVRNLVEGADPGLRDVLAAVLAGAGTVIVGVVVFLLVEEPGRKWAKSLVRRNPVPLVPAPVTAD